MRLKTMLLGLLSLFLVSGSGVSDIPDRGFNPGEKLPSIVVDGVDISEALAENPKAVLVVWSVKDATSRVANAWVCNSTELQTNHTPIYSICTDGDDLDAVLYAKIDGASTLITPKGLEGEGQKRGSLQALASRGSSKVYYTSYGMIEKVLSSKELFRQIQ